MIKNKKYNLQFFFIKTFEFKHVKASKTFQLNIVILMSYQIHIKCVQNIFTLIIK